MRGLENSKRDNTEVRVRNMVNTTDNFVHKIEILGTNLNGMRADLQANQICMRKLEELCEQTANNMAVIHRYMHTGAFLNVGAIPTYIPSKHFSFIHRYIHTLTF